MNRLVSRRKLIAGLAIGAGGLLTGCDRLAKNESFRHALFSAENIHRWAQRLLTDRDALAREFSPEERSPYFRTNGTRNLGTPEYTSLAKGKFVDYRLRSVEHTSELQSLMRISYAVLCLNKSK